MGFKDSFAIIMLLLTSLGQAAEVEEKPIVIWGGMAISSGGEATLAPVARALQNCDEVDEAGNCPIDILIRSLTLNTNFDKISVVNSYAEDRINYLISPVIDVEWVNRVKLADGEKPFVYQFIVAGSFFIYETSPSETKLLSSVPLALNFSKYYTHELTRQQEADIFRSIYLNDDAYKGDVGYYNFFYNLINESKSALDRPLKWDTGGVQFTGISFSEQAASALKGDVGLDQLSKLFATWATANLADATGEPIIPTTTGENDLLLVFKDKEMQIILPEPMYEFDIHVQAAETYRNSKYTCFDVAAYYGVKAFDTMLLDAPVQHGENSCAFLEGGMAKASNLYPANLLSQIQKVMYGFSSNNSDWRYLKSHVVGEVAAIEAAMKEIRSEVFNAD